MMLRLEEFELETTATLHVRDVRGALTYNKDGSPRTIELLCNDDARVQAQEDLAVDRRFKNIQRIRMSSAELKAEALDKLVAATVSWTYKTQDGEDFPCNRETVRELYKTYPPIREQVDQFIADRANFLSKSATD